VAGGTRLEGYLAEGLVKAANGMDAPAFYGIT
jgi:hypothetical protein